MSQCHNGHERDTTNCIPKLRNENEMKVERVKDRMRLCFFKPVGFPFSFAVVFILSFIIELVDVTAFLYILFNAFLSRKVGLENAKAQLEVENEGKRNR